MKDLELVVDNKDINGESPIWKPSEGKIYWVDTNKTNVYDYDLKTRQTTVYPVDPAVGQVRALGRAQRNKWVLVTTTGLYLWKKGEPSVQFLAAPDRDKADMLLDDGVVDPAGRYLVNTFNCREYDRPDGSLYAYDLDGTVRLLDNNLVLPNGIAFSRDGTIMYLAEMFKCRILCYDYDAKTGVAKNRRVFATIATEAGMPDGIITDQDGYVWVGHWLGWRISRYAPDGSLDRVFEMPFATATCMAFGGRSLNDLYITTATAGLSGQDLVDSDHPGGLFRLKTAYKGTVESIFTATIPVRAQ